MPASHGYTSSQAGPSDHAKAQRLRVQPPPRGKGNHQQHQQPPPKSSLDLAWSYSRSQAHGPLESSPSFTEKHWAGPHAQPDSEEDGDLDDEEEETGDEDIEEDIEDDVGDATILEGVDAGPRVAHPQVRRLATEERPVYSRGRSRDRSPKRLNVSSSNNSRSSSGVAADVDRRGRRRSPRDGSSSLLLAAAAPGGMDSPRVGSHYERYSLRSSSRADSSDGEDDDDGVGHRRRPRMRRHSSSYRSDGGVAGGDEQQRRPDDESTPLLRRQRSANRSQSMPLSTERPRTPRPVSMEGNGDAGRQDRESGQQVGWLAKLWTACFSCCAGRRP